MLEINNLFYTKDKNSILNDITAKFNNGEIIGIAGNSGSGKSILLKILSGELKEYRGKIQIESQSISDLKNRELNKIISYLPQNYRVDNNKSVYQFLSLARYPFKKIFSALTDTDNQIINNYIEEFELSDYSKVMLSTLPDDISKRVLLAFTFIREPNIILLDNPTEYLQISSLKLLQKRINKYLIDGDKIIIISSSDISFLAQVSDRIIIMDKGKFVEDGTTDIITQDLIKKYFNTEVFISRNIYNGRPQIHFFPDN